MKLKKIFLFLVILLLSSCGVNNSNSSSDNSSTSLSSSNTLSNSSLSPSTSKTFQKDEKGFYILEDGYFDLKPQSDDKKISKLVFSRNIEEDYIYPNMRLYAMGENIPIYNVKTNVSHSWTKEAASRVDNGVVSLELEGKVEFTLQCNFGIKKMTIRPLSEKVPNIVDEARRTIKFEISKPGQYTIEFIGNRTLHIFVNSYHQYEEYRNMANVIYFGSGVHNAKNSNYISSDNFVHLKSNQIVFLDVGAVIQGGFVGYKLNNIKIVGSGIVDNSMFERNVDTGAKLVPYDFSYCTDLNFKGVTNLDPAGWCYNIYFCSNVTIDNIKIISSRSNGDGISIQSSKDVFCYNSFVRTWDDSLVIKNYPQWDNQKEGSTKGILFENMIIWTDLAQCLEIGYETYGQQMEDITFNNIVILHAYHNAPISIHNGNNADIKNVVFKNITIEDGSMGLGNGKNYLIDFSTEYSSTWSNGHGVTSLGSIDGVIVQNVLVIKGNKNPEISIIGAIDSRPAYNESKHLISNVKLIDIKIIDTLVTADYLNLHQYLTQNVTITNCGDVVGASFLEKKVDNSADYGTKFQVEIK